MKARFIGAAVLFIVSTAITASAQNFSSPVIKILPGARQYSVKLLVAEHDNTDVEVEFYSAEGAIAIDRINGSDSNNGFLKNYDLQKLQEKSFWMAVRTNTMSVIYKITRSGHGVEARLEEATYTSPIVAAR